MYTRVSTHFSLRTPALALALARSRSWAPDALPTPYRTSAEFPPRPSRPNPHPTPLTPRAPRGECYGQGVRWWLHVGALSAGCKVRPTSCAPICIFTTTYAQPSAKIGCRHFIKSLRIICRLAHRTARRLGGCTAPLAPLHRAGLWRCLRRMRAFICSLAVVAVPSSSVCLSSSGRLCVLFGFVLSPHAYRWGPRPRPLPLSGSCRARVRAARGHAAIAALRRSGWYLFCRLPRCAAAAPPRGFPPVQLPGVCPRGGASDCPSDSDLIYRLPHR